MKPKYTKEELYRFIIEENLSYEEIGRKYEITGAAIKKAAKNFGISLPIRQTFPEGFKPANYKGGTYKYIPLKNNKCNHCGEPCRRKYCSHRCQYDEQSKVLYENFLQNQESFENKKYNPSCLKPLFLKEQNNKCIICNMENTWNNKPLVFILDHIDGNADNNRRDNLRLVCPNCDTQLDTYKSKNKNSARKDRYFKQRNGDNIS